MSTFNERFGTSHLRIASVRTARGDIYVVGSQSCHEIHQHHAVGEGDRWFYDVHLDAMLVRIFDAIEVVFEKPAAEEGAE